MKNILVKKLMSRQFVQLSPGSDIQTLLKRMTEANHSCVLICTEDETPIGIVTERDIVKTLQQLDNPSDIFSLTVAELMSSPVIRLNQEQSLFNALVISRAHSIRHFPVVDDQERLVGIITSSDLANAHFQVVEMQSEMIEKMVAQKTKELVEANQELLALSLEDQMLAIGNRRAMEVDLEYTHASALRYRQIYSVVLLDLDYFKHYNDNYGHQAGDEVLKRAASCFKSSIRKADRIYRYGGEEILLLLPSTDLLQAQSLANKLVACLAGKNIPHLSSPFKTVTASAGVACIANGGNINKEWKQTVQQADEALYRAKANGRNQVELATPERDERHTG